MYARIEGGVVAELIEPIDAFSLTERFGATFAASCVALSAGTNVAQGWRYQDGAFLAPAVPAMTAEQARAKRNALLAACDWTQLPDAPLSSLQRLEWADYRRELRAVTDQPGFPAEVAWPAAPG